MKHTLVGASGFVGSNFMRVFPETTAVSRASLHSGQSGEKVESLVIAGPSANKWLANAGPEEDLRQVAAFGRAIVRRFSPKRVILFSTIDVYGSGTGDESLDPAPTSPYGANRLALADQLADAFPQLFVSRLPGLFGPSLRKNLLYDIRNDRSEFIQMVNPQSTFQWMDVRSAIRLSLQRHQAGEENLVNLVSEPLQVSEIPLGGSWMKSLDARAPRVQYKVTSRHTLSGYWLSKEGVVASIARWSS